MEGCKAGGWLSGRRRWVELDYDAKQWRSGCCFSPATLISSRTLLSALPLYLSIHSRSSIPTLLLVAICCCYYLTHYHTISRGLKLRLCIVVVVAAVTRSGLLSFLPLVHCSSIRHALIVSLTKSPSHHAAVELIRVG